MTVSDQTPNSNEQSIRPGSRPRLTDHSPLSDCGDGTRVSAPAAGLGVKYRLSKAPKRRSSWPSPFPLCSVSTTDPQAKRNASSATKVARSSASPDTNPSGTLKTITYGAVPGAKA